MKKDDKRIEKLITAVSKLRAEAKKKSLEEKWPQWIKFHEGQMSGLDQALDEIARVLGWDPDKEE